MTSTPPTHAARFLAETNAKDAELEQKWASSNEQWWNWYLSLAHDDGDDASGGQVSLPPLPEFAPLAPHALEQALAEPYALSPESVARFRRDGFVKLKDVCPAPALLALRRELRQLFDATVEERPEMRFPSLEMMWTVAPIARAFVMSPRLARIAAELLGVAAVRLYHDNALSKLPGCGRTPWHYDAHHYPIESDSVITLWAPLQPTPRAMGPLAFARGIDTWRRVEDLRFDKFDDSYDREIIRVLRDADVPVEDGPFELGELSFHHTHSLHTAGPNRTDRSRIALATTYFEDGARIVDSPTLISGDYEKFMPGIEPGAKIDSPLNPVLYRAEA